MRGIDILQNISHIGFVYNITNKILYHYKTLGIIKLDYREEKDVINGPRTNGGHHRWRMILNMYLKLLQHVRSFILYPSYYVKHSIKISWFAKAPVRHLHLSNSKPFNVLLIFQTFGIR